ncbi:MAG TPA: 1-deoxy-D-xylulose-5-phosphate synthase N-terminal domain-containing protein [Gaiellaceae bacterium]|nr:1-deoxy-D-xylulose-5-phosphate synthase N-terminal domain-containing protein [Gaiellaceae bacterium]
MATTTKPKTLGYDDLPGLMTRLTGDEKHDWSSLSTLDVLWVLYDRVLADGARFLLSKGHGPAAYYAVLAAKGLIPVELLDGFGSFDSPLGYHPDRNRAPGVELSSGSLGHGVAVAVGSALTGRRVFCLVGDAELEEGSNWEAVQYAGRVGATSLTAIVVDNHSSTHGWPGGVERRFALEGWATARVDGRDHDALAEALTPDPRGTRPRCVVAEVTR